VPGEPVYAATLASRRTATPDTIVDMVVHEIGRQVDRPVEPDGAAKAAAMIGELL
jgi:hypothetical protein